MTQEAVLDAGPGGGEPYDELDPARLLLAVLPGALVAAVDESGLFTPVPGPLATSGHRVIDGHLSALELVVHEDIPAVIDAWQTVLREGSSCVTVHPSATPGATMTIHFVDVRPQHGVVLCVVESEVPVTGTRTAGEDLRPRVSIVRKNEVAVFTEVDLALERMLGRTDLVGRRNLELVHPDDQKRAIANWMDLLASPGASRRVRLRQQHADGRWIWFEITNRNRLNDPEDRCVVAEMIDISDEMAAHEFVVAQEFLLRRLTDTLPVGVAQIDPTGLIVHRNVRLTEMLGRAEAATIDELLAGVVEADRETLATALAEGRSGADRNVEIGLCTATGRDLRCNLILRPIDHQGTIVCIDDITEHARLRDQLHRRATYDALTGCLNRASLLHELDHALAGSGAGVAVVFIDLDAFKPINDRYGHSAGDAVLTAVGERLLACVRDGDIVGRFGGDEFIAVGTGMTGEAQAVAMGERIATALAGLQTPREPGRAVASIGVAWTGPDARDTLRSEVLVAQADAAMYRSKQQGLGRPVLHS